METRHQSQHAVVVLPPGGGGQIQDPRLRRWLSRGALDYVPLNQEVLYTVLQNIGHSAKGEGLAALRLWGQTGERSAAWIAAVDPVHLEARLDHLCLYALRGSEMPMADLRLVFDYLQETFGSDRYAFARVGRHAYLRGEDSMASAILSARVVDGNPPDKYMPGRARGLQDAETAVPIGAVAEARSHHGLLSEVQMALHECEVNIQRESRGLRAINSIWIWGGGSAPEICAKPIVPLFADDPMFKGFWNSRTGLSESWADFDACLELSDKGFVAVIPERDAGEAAEAPDSYLRRLQQLMKQNELGRLTLLFRDGLRVRMLGTDARKFWRRESPCVAPQ